MLCFCNVTISNVSTVDGEYWSVVCVGKNLGIAASGLKELVRVLQGQSEPAHSGTSPFPSAGMEARY